MSKEHEAVTKFRSYLKIEAVSSLEPEKSMCYDESIKFLEDYAKDIGIDCRVIEVLESPRRGVVLMTVPGSDPSLPSLLLNSHYDVVPVFREHWKYEPFGAYKDDKGDIYARGAQDMKCVTIQYLEAIRRIKAEGRQLLRTIHLSFVPDEEVTGRLGMMLFVETPEFAELNVGLALDEGLANPDDAYTVFYGERAPWWINVVCRGNPGHGSRFIPNNAGEKVRRIINQFLSFRDEQEQRLLSDPTLRLGDVTTVNLTSLKGGIQHNVLPSELSVVFDIRVTPADIDTMEARINEWCKKAGEDVELQFIQKFEGNMITPISEDNLWWQAFTGVCDQLNMKIEKEIFPAATDSRFLRKRGLPVIGFSPMNKTPILLHDHNEMLNEEIFLHGITVFHHLLPALANVPANGS